MREGLPAELVRLLSARDAAESDAAWGRFVETHSKLILHAARSLGGDYDAAMDRYSFVLEQLRRDDCQRLRTFVADGRGKFTTWLFVVARRLCLDHHRHRYGRPRGSADSSTEEAQRARKNLADLVSPQLDLELADDRVGDPEADLRGAELQRCLSGALAELEPRDRLLLRLRFHDDLSAPQIARLMAFPTPFHVYRRLNQLLLRLRRALLLAGVEDPVP